MQDLYLFIKGLINSTNVVLGLSTPGQLANDPLDKGVSLDKTLCHTLACSSGLTDYIGLVFQYISIFTKTFEHIFLACYVGYYCLLLWIPQQEVHNILKPKDSRMAQ